MSSYENVHGHSSMIFDDVRNSAYFTALKESLNSDSVVLDLGSGLGIHGLMAAANGARKIYLVDPSPVIAIARQIANQMGLGASVVTIQKPIEEAELPEKVDLIVSVFTGNFLLSEDLLPVLFYARDKYLKPGGGLTPESAEMRVVPVCAPEYYDRLINQWSKKPQGIDFSLVRRFSVNTLHFDGANSRSADFLSDPETISTIDFYTAVKAECFGTATFTVQEAAECHGFLGWFRMKVGNSWLSTSPKAPATHWSQVFLPLERPVCVSEGDELSLEIRRPQFGDWTWTSQFKNDLQKQSTFFSNVMSMEQFRSRSLDYRPKLNQMGKLTAFVLQQVALQKSNEEIINTSQELYSSDFLSAEELENKVRSTIAYFSE